MTVLNIYSQRAGKQLCSQIFMSIMSIKRWVDGCKALAFMLYVEYKGSPPPPLTFLNVSFVKLKETYLIDMKL